MVYSPDHSSAVVCGSIGRTGGQRTPSRAGAGLQGRPLHTANITTSNISRSAYTNT